MKITLRLIVSLVLVVGTVALGSAWLHVRAERARQLGELERRAHVLAESLQETIEPVLKRGATKELLRVVERFGNRERLAGVAVYDAGGKAVAVTATLAPLLPADGGPSGLAAFGGRTMHVYSLPLDPGGALVLFHDAAYIDAQLGTIWRRTALRLAVQFLLIALVTLLIVRWSIVGPIARMADWMRDLRAGGAADPLALPAEDILSPISREVTTFARHLSAARTAAEEEARLRQSVETVWTPERLKEHVKARLQGKPLLVVSNREPYMHLRRGRKVETIVPAGGLVTALEPMMRACGGTWIAHGAGDADWETADAKGKLRVPTEDPLYTLKRVAMSKEEEDGYYYGFSNEGLWPLCHLAHARPTFRPEDWAHYQEVNRRFAKATLEEMEGIDEPLVLIQDYHFALLPRLIKAERPDARVALFWHIPWPNPEAFGICPWAKELLYGMLGADLVGFHTQFHCNNFLDTVDRSLESRIHWERFTVTKEGHATTVKPFPISVAFPDPFQDVERESGPAPDRKALLKDLGVEGELLGVGVDRIDYTKGILERVRSVERLLEKHPEYVGRLTFVQIGAPSRTHIKRYSDFIAEVESEVERINWRFKAGAWKPLVFLKRHHSHQEILPYYRAADFCLVSSLADGMNLVAKEFASARGDEGGALILSRFAGAAQELRDAFIVNPYDIDQTAEAIRTALESDPSELKARMRRLRAVIRENNIYRWAGNLTEDLARIRIDPVPPGDPDAVHPVRMRP